MRGRAAVATRRVGGSRAETAMLSPHTGHQGTPLHYHVPNDTWEEGTWSEWAQWPLRVPGWYNVEKQPLNRPVFKRSESGKISIVPDLNG